MTERRLILLLNASAGTVQKLGPARVSEELEAVFARHGIGLTIQPTEPQHLRRQAERAARDARAGTYAGVIVGGGDGTVQTVARALVGTPVALGVLPLGTLNHFARDVGMPATLSEAAEVIALGHTREVDVGLVNGRVFINNSSIGFYPHMVRARERRQRNRIRLPKWLASLWASMRVLRYPPLRRLTITAEGRSQPFRSPCVFVGNNEYVLSGQSRGRRAVLDDGVLCLYVTERQSRLALFGLGARLVFNRLDPQRDLVSLKVHELTVATRRRRRLLVSLDGEIELIRAPLSYRVRPRALRVFAPGV